MKKAIGCLILLVLLCITFLGFVIAYGIKATIGLILFTCFAWWLVIFAVKLIEE